MRKHIKKLHFQCESCLSIDGETKPTKRIFCHLNKELNGTEHNYNIEIYPSMQGGYGLAVYLCLRASNSNDILVYRENYETSKEAQIDAVRIVLELEQANLTEEIKEWKKGNVNPVFDTKLNHIGDIYTTFQILRKDQKSYDYYNSNPLKSLYGKFFRLYKRLDQPCYDIIDSGYDSVCSKTGKDKEILNKMINQIKNNKKYERFFTKL